MSGQTYGSADFVQSLARGLAVIRAFDAENPRLSSSEVARRAGIPRAAAGRFLRTLETLGYVRGDGKLYALTPRVLELGFSYLSALSLPEIVQPHLEALSHRLDESVSAAVLDGADIVYIERCRAPGPREIDLNLHVGSRLPAYCTSMGKVLLAFLPPRERNELLDGVALTRRGPNTITAKRRLLKELERVRQTRLAVNNEELAYGLRSIAVPVWSQTGDVVAAINIAVHRSLVSMDELLEDLAPALVSTASEISARIGFNGVAHGVH